MKSNKLSFILLTAFIIFSCAKQQNDLTRLEANGSVKSIRTTGYEAIEKFGEICEGDFDGTNTLFEFNKDGYITSISDFNKRGDLERKSIYVFNDDGKVDKINKYDGDGNEIGRTVYTYNSDHKVVKIVDYDKSGKINYTQKNEWDGDKCKSLFMNEYSEGDYSIDEYKGDYLVKSVAYDKTGKKTGEYMEYENGKVTKIVKQDFTVSLTYNDKWLCTSIVNGQISSIASYRLSKGESFLYEYEYDDKGNWIRRVEKEKQSNKAKRIFVREIDYY